MASKKPAGLLGWLIILWKAIDALSNLEFIQNHMDLLSRIDGFMQSGIGTLSIIGLGLVLVWWSKGPVTAGPITTRVPASRRQGFGRPLAEWSFDDWFAAIMLVAGAGFILLVLMV